MWLAAQPAPAGRLRRILQLLLRHQDRRKRRRPVYNIQFTDHQNDGGKDYRQHCADQLPVVVVHCASPETSDCYAAARSSLSAPRATILSASSANGRWRLCFIPWAAHPNIALFIGRQDHRHRLGMDRLNNGIRRGGQKTINEAGRGYQLACFSSPSLIRCRPGVVIRSLPSRSTI